LRTATIRKLGKGEYIEGEFKFYSDGIETNWAYAVEAPTWFEAYGRGIKSGNWRSFTSLLNKVSQIQWNFDNYNLAVSEYDWFRFWGFCSMIDALNKAYEAYRFGNHGVSGMEFQNLHMAQLVYESLKPIVEEANKLLDKLFPKI